MDWKQAERFEGGGKGSYQETKDPPGYCITFAIKGDDRAVFIASYRGTQFASFYVDPSNKAACRNAARAMRAACGMHNESR